MNSRSNVFITGIDKLLREYCRQNCRWRPTEPDGIFLHLWHQLFIKSSTVSRTWHAYLSKYIADVLFSAISRQLGKLRNFRPLAEELFFATCSRGCSVTWNWQYFSRVVVFGRLIAICRGLGDVSCEWYEPVKVLGYRSRPALRLIISIRNEKVRGRALCHYHGVYIIAEFSPHQPPWKQITK